MLVPSVVDAIIDFLEDGIWHHFGNISRHFGLTEIRVREIVSFLARFGFADADFGGKKVKLNSSLLEFLRDP